MTDETNYEWRDATDDDIGKGYRVRVRETPSSDWDFRDHDLYNDLTRSTSRPEKWSRMGGGGGDWMFAQVFAPKESKEMVPCRVNPDSINPDHYKSHPSGVECVQITEHMNFCRGNAIKYIWRAGEKGDEIEDLKKAAWYINREIARIERQREQNQPKQCD